MTLVDLCLWRTCWFRIPVWWAATDHDALFVNWYIVPENQNRCVEKMSGIGSWTRRWWSWRLFAVCITRHLIILPDDLVLNYFVNGDDAVLIKSGDDFHVLMHLVFDYYRYDKTVLNICTAIQQIQIKLEKTFKPEDGWSESAFVDLSWQRSHCFTTMLISANRGRVFVVINTTGLELTTTKTLNRPSWESLWRGNRKQYGWSKSGGCENWEIQWWMEARRIFFGWTKRIRNKLPMMV